jgi:hypothetical protein
LGAAQEEKTAMDNFEDDIFDEPQRQRPWIVLTNTYDVEAWIDQYNRSLRKLVTSPTAVGYGICFHLTHGGEIFMHTSPEGIILLDVTEEAMWIAPVIIAATGVAAPQSRIWQLPGETLTQLIIGMSSLIQATSFIPSHDFKLKKKRF